MRAIAVWVKRGVDVGITVDKAHCVDVHVKARTGYWRGEAKGRRGKYGFEVAGEIYAQSEYPSIANGVGLPVLLFERRGCLQ